MKQQKKAQQINKNLLTDDNNRNVLKDHHFCVINFLSML